MERRKHKVESNEADVGESVNKAISEFEVLKANVHESSVRLDNAFWWLDVAGWLLLLGRL
jgi:hypothetical protein